MGFLILSVSVISLVCVALSDSARQYVTTVKKNVKGVIPNLSENVVIPDGQCSGFIDKSLLCLTEAAGAVQVEVRDSVAFPSVSIDSSLTSATIQRVPDPSGNCAGEVEVQVSYYCVPDQTSVIKRRSLRQIPTAPLY